MSGLAFLLALAVTIIGYKKGWFDSQTDEDKDDIFDTVILSELLNSDS